MARYGDEGRLKLRRAVNGPHAAAPVMVVGPPVEEARLAVVMLHGRGADPADILPLRNHLRADGAVFVAPGAVGGQWYPQRFVAPLEANQPFLSSALDLVAAIVEELEARGVPGERIVLLGFSQGGCLALEHGARQARRWGGLVGLSAGLIGPPGHVWAFQGSLDGTPVVLGCSERDPHIPVGRVDETSRELARLGGSVWLRIYPGSAHAVFPDEIEQVQRVLDGLAGA